MQPPASRSTVTYHSIHELPLYLFIKADVHNDLSVLGHPSPEATSAAWNIMLSQYHETIGDIAVTMRLHLFKAITLLRIDYSSIFILVNALRSRYVAYFHRQLNLLTNADFVMPENPADPAYKSTLLRYIKRSKSLEQHIRLKEIELENLKEGAEKAPKTTLAYYEDTLISLSDHAKLPITDQISTYTYCARVKRLTDYIKRQNSRK